MAASASEPSAKRVCYEGRIPGSPATLECEVGAAALDRRPGPKIAANFAFLRARKASLKAHAKAGRARRLARRSELSDVVVLICKKHDVAMYVSSDLKAPVFDLGRPYDPTARVLDLEYCPNVVASDAWDLKECYLCCRDRHMAMLREQPRSVRDNTPPLFVSHELLLPAPGNNQLCLGLTVGTPSAGLGDARVEAALLDLNFQAIFSCPLLQDPVFRHEAPDWWCSIATWAPGRFHQVLQVKDLAHTSIPDILITHVDTGLGGQIWACQFQIHYPLDNIAFRYRDPRTGRMTHAYLETASNPMAAFEDEANAAELEAAPSTTSASTDGEALRPSRCPAAPARPTRLTTKTSSPPPPPCDL
jgi:hypothetical protein